jgi:uncharacterized membrane protein YeaQ/YmgE (transglycosylase-associated protein family)
MTVVSILSALVVGLIVGFLGRLVVPGRQNIPLWLTLVIGVVAALLGTAVARAIGVDTTGFSVLEFLLQVLLAAVGVAIVAGGFHRRGRRSRL